MPPCPWKAPAEAKGAARKPVEFPEPSAPQRHQIVIWNKGASPKREPVTAGDARKKPLETGASIKRPVSDDAPIPQRERGAGAGHSKRIGGLIDGQHRIRS